MLVISVVACGGATTHDELLNFLSDISQLIASDDQIGILQSIIIEVTPSPTAIPGIMPGISFGIDGYDVPWFQFVFLSSNIGGLAIVQSHNSTIAVIIEFGHEKTFGT